MDKDFDIAICGGGPVGLTLASLLASRGIAPERIALIDARSAEHSARDPRSIALSYGSRQILESVAAWPVPATPIHEIHVSRRGHFGRTLIRRDEYGLPALGYVARYGELVATLNARVAALGIEIVRPTVVTALTENTQGVQISLDNGEQIRARLMAQAEGGVFSDQSKRSVHRDYDQTAIVTHVTASSPIHHRAFERFTDEGPLALLPQEDGYAVVWCMHPERAQRMLALTDAQFLAALADTFGGRLGSFTATARRNSFALGLNAQLACSTRVVAIGNAAQTLHPVAGQGLNLGLRDAHVLACALARSADIGALEDFAKQRRKDRDTTIRLTDVMARVFANARGARLSQVALGMGLGLIDGLGAAKRSLAEQMMFGRRDK